jgi:demethylmenaquinone methyltransferase/2-methoxy-6-polyprenyl-1,4-benzoquinol methylase
MYLPFGEDCFDRVVSGFLLRNTPDLEQALGEQGRILRAGGRMAALDTTPPRPGPFRWAARLHVRFGIPLLGRLFSVSPSAYHYLQRTTEAFFSAEAVEDLLKKAGFVGTGFITRMLGSVAIHWGTKHRSVNGRN